MEQVPEWIAVTVETTIRSRLTAAQREALSNGTDDEQTSARQEAMARVVASLQMALDLEEDLEGGFFTLSSSSTWRRGHWTTARP